MHCGHPIPQHSGLLRTSDSTLHANYASPLPEGRRTRGQERGRFFCFLFWLGKNASFSGYVLLERLWAQGPGKDGQEGEGQGSRADFLSGLEPGATGKGARTRCHREGARIVG